LAIISFTWSYITFGKTPSMGDQPVARPTTYTTVNTNTE
jgi:hypothetical protein